MVDENNNINQQTCNNTNNFTTLIMDNSPKHVVQCSYNSNHADNNNLKTKEKLKSVTRNTLINFINKTFDPQGKILPLINIPVQTKQGTKEICALIDTGSDESYISTPILDRISYKKTDTKQQFCIQTTNGRKNMQAYVATITLQKPANNIKFLNLYIQENQLSISQKPDEKLAGDKELNSAMASKQLEIHVIIGVDLIWQLVDHISIKRNMGLIKFHTCFGTTYAGMRSLTSLYQHASVVVPVTAIREIVRKTIHQYAVQKVCQSIESLSKALGKLWSMETFENDWDETGLSEGEKKAVDRVKKECILDPKTKRFVTSILLKDNPNLVNNWYRALAQARTLHRSMRKDPKKKKIFEDKMNEFKEHDCIKQVQTKQPEKDEAYYVPSRLVQNDKSPTTPYRLTANASSPTASHESVNSEVLPTPVPTGVIAKIMLQNRKHKYILCYDVRKMYIQIAIAENQQKWLRFVWMNPNEDDPTPEVWAFTKLIWGLSTAAFISAYCIEELIRMCMEDPASTPREKKNAMIMYNSIYVDDVSICLNSQQELWEFWVDTEKLLAQGSFPIGKAVSNSSELLKKIPEDQRLPVDEINGELVSQDSSVLGYPMHWKTDSISFEKYKTLGEEFNGTFRSLVSIVARIYDPLGLTGPLQFTARLTARSCFKIKMKWDEKIGKISEEEQKQFEKWIADLYHLKDFRVPRYFENNSDSEYYFYSDASQVGICSVAYCRTKLGNGTFDSNLVAARCTPASLKHSESMTIPKLELQSTLQCTRLWEFVSDALEIEKKQCHFRNDNVAALWWLRGVPDKLICFVANRVRKIQSKGLTFEYVKTHENPADIGTRPAFVDDIKSTLWLKGPEHLRMDKVPISKVDFDAMKNSDMGVKKQYTLVALLTISCHATKKCHKKCTRTERLPLNLNNFSRLDEATRRIAIISWAIDKWITHIKTYARCSFREGRIAYRPRTEEHGYSSIVDKQKLRCTVKRWQKPPDKSKKHIGHIPIEMRHKKLAERLLIKQMQEEYFEVELARLLGAKKNNHPPHINHKSPLYGITPHLDEHNIIRVCGRLHSSTRQSNEKHPIIVHHKSPLSNLIIMKCHEEQRHAPYGVTLTQVRLKYWILRAVSATKQALQKCITCQKATNPCMRQSLGPFKAERYVTSAERTTVVIDYSGAFTIRQVKDENGKSGFFKAYIVIYLQLNTRFIYLDVVENNTTASFLESFESYCNTYGRPAKCMTDAAGYFKKAAKTLRKQNKLSAELEQTWAEIQAKTDVTWEFNPPYSPHKGADWERNLKTVKQLLHRVLEPTNTTDPKSRSYWPLNIKNFKNILTHIASIMNSRPLHAPDGTGLNMENYITPARLVFGHDLLQAPAGLDECDNLPYDIRDMMKHRKEIVQKYWNLFMEEYIPSLQKQHRWGQPEMNIRLNQIVYIKPRQQIGLKRPFWKMARVVKITKDLKGLVRNIHVFLPVKYTSKGTRILNSVISMPVQHCVPLELDAPGSHWSADLPPGTGYRPEDLDNTETLDQNMENENDSSDEEPEKE